MGIILGAIIIGKIVYKIFSSFFRALTSKTETKLDDIIIDMIEEPIVAALIVFGVWFALNGLNLPVNFTEMLGHLMQFVIVMMIAWLLTRL